jgi:hypothetical protein
MLMICPEDKYVAFTRYLGLWQAAKFLSLDECETAVGLLSWGSAGLPTLKACIAPLIHMRTSVKRLTKASSSGKVWQQAISPNARSALDFARVVFTEWDRSCAIVQGFGPTAMWDSLGRCDASGTGCGGILVNGSELLGFYHQWTADELKRGKVDDGSSSTIFELMGATYWATVFGEYVRDSRALLEMDCGPAVQDIQKAFSSSPRILTCVTEFRLAIARASVHLRARFVVGDVFNRISDALSRGNPTQACRVALAEFALHLTLLPCAL